MKNTIAKFAVIAAVAAVPCFGTTLEAREMTGGEVAVRIVHDVQNFLNPIPTVITVEPAPPAPVVVAPPPVYEVRHPEPPPPPRHEVRHHHRKPEVRHHEPARPAAPARRHGR